MKVKMNVINIIFSVLWNCSVFLHKAYIGNLQNSYLKKDYWVGYDYLHFISLDTVDPWLLVSGGDESIDNTVDPWLRLDAGPLICVQQRRVADTEARHPVASLRLHSGSVSPHTEPPHGAMETRNFCISSINCEEFYEEHHFNRFDLLILQPVTSELFSGNFSNIKHKFELKIKV